MKKPALIVALLGLALTALVLGGCGKKTLGPSDPERDFVGEWSWEKRVKVGDDLITERITVIYYDPKATAVLGGMSGAGFIASGEDYVYRWTYRYLVNGDEDLSKRTEEMGIFVADGTEIQFISKEGDTKVYQYLIPSSSSEIDMILTDQDGVEWIFDRKEAAW